MIHRLASLTIVIVTSIFAGGCCVDRVYRPTGCQDSCAPLVGSCGSGGSCGDSCGVPTSCPSIKQSLTCGAGCGEMYWGEWTSDPPDPCDPCDNCGNWVGQRCCPVRESCGQSCGQPQLFNRFWTGLAGWRYTGSGCCEQESHGMSGIEGEMITDGEVIYDGPVLAAPAPTEGSPTEATPRTQEKPPSASEQEDAKEPPATEKSTDDIFDSEPRPSRAPDSVLEKQATYRSTSGRKPPQLLKNAQGHGHSQGHQHGQSSVLRHRTAAHTPSHAGTARMSNQPAYSPMVKAPTRYR